MSCLTVLLLFMPFPDEGPRIRYIASDRVYLDQGSDDGLGIGDLLAVTLADGSEVHLEIVSVAASTAACTTRGNRMGLEVGQRVRVIRKMPRPEAIEAEEEEPEPEVPIVEEPEPEPPTETRRAPFSGKISLQLYHFADGTDAGRDFSQPGLRINLRGENLFGGAYSLRVKTRTRYISREISEFSSLPETEWRNRVYQFALTYEDPRDRFSYSVGRVPSAAVGGIGYIDGAVANLHLGTRHRIGVFAGTQPEWQYSDLDTSLTKYGLYYRYKQGDTSKGRFESIWALAGEYAGSEINREAIHVRNRYASGRFTFYQSAELEINRDWRKDRAGDSFEISSLHAYLRFHASRAFRVGLSYDDRQRYYTYELRNRDERFFDDLARRGLRADLRVRINSRAGIHANIGRRERDTDQADTSFYLVNAYLRNLFPRTNASLRFNGFESSLTEGQSLSFRLERRFGRFGNTIALSTSTYRYDYLTNGTDRDSSWLRMETYWRLTRAWFLSGHLEHNSGDDAEGQRILLEIGYRF